MKYRILLCTCLMLAAFVASAHLAPAGTSPRTDPAAPAYSWPAIDLDRDGVFDRLDRCPGTRPGVEVDQCGCAMFDASPPAIRAAAAYPPGVRSTYRDDLMRHGWIRLDMAFFETERAALRPDAKHALRDVAAVIRAYPTLKFEVAGHADSRGTEAYNRRLSERRALEVHRFLVEACRVREIQLVARGFGETRLATGERDGFEFQANRRVEFRCVNPEAMPRGSKVEAREAAVVLAAQLQPVDRRALVAVR